MADRSTPSKKQAAGTSWMMLDRFVYRRDGDDGSFPDEAATRIRAKSSTSLGDLFTVALLPADPPALSRLYVQWPRGPGEGEPADPDDDKVTQVLASHRRLFLLKTTCCVNVDKTPYRQDYFVFKAGLGGGNSLLKRLPPCTEPIVLTLHGKKKSKKTTMDRMFHEDTVGLVRSSSSSDEFAVVQLAKFSEIHPGKRQMGAELCVFRSRLSSSESIHEDSEGGVVAEGKWEVLLLPIHHSEEEFSDLQGFSSDGAVTFNNSICWVAYHHGGILSYTPAPLEAEGMGQNLISYVRLPINNRPNNSLPSQYPLEMYRSLCVTGPKDNERLNFVDVACDDGAFFGMIRHGSSFTITCYTAYTSRLLPLHLKWCKDAVITSEELWHPKSHKSLIPQNAVLMFPLVNRDKPNLVYFLMPEPSNNIDKVSVVVIDIITKKAVSVSAFIEGEEDLCGKHADMVSYWSRLPRPFLPCQLI